MGSKQNSIRIIFIRKRRNKSIRKGFKKVNEKRFNQSDRRGERVK